MTQPESPQVGVPAGKGAPEYQFGSGTVDAVDGRVWPAVTIGFGPITQELIGPPESWPVLTQAFLSHMQAAYREAIEKGSGLTIATAMPPEPSPNGSVLLRS